MTRARRRCAVVLSSDAIGLGVVRSLHAGGVPAIAVMLHRWEPVRFSRYALKRRVADSENVESSILDALREIQPIPRPVLIPTSDFFADFMARHRPLLERGYRCSIPPASVVRNALDKASAPAWLEGPTTRIPRTVSRLPLAPRELLQQLDLPLIFKPRTYIDRRELGWRTVVAHDRRDVDRFYREHDGELGRVIAQELIPGGDEALWECICVFDRNSELVSAFTFRKLRTMPAHYGGTSFARSERNTEIIEQVRTFGKRTGYVGPADFDIKFDHRDDTYRFLELNPRLGMCHHFGTRCGVNLALAAYHVACDDAVPPATQEDGLLFFAALEDTGARVGAGDPLGRVLIDLVSTLRSKPVGAYFAPDDPLPGPLTAIRKLLQLLKNTLRRFAPPLRPLESQAGHKRNHAVRTNPNHPL